MSLAMNTMNTSNMRRPKVAILSMQKNEGELLESWLSFYESLFGRDSIFIFDNGSTDERTLACLHDAKCRDIFVESKPNPSDFEKKGVILLEKAKSLFEQGFDLAYFSDADEFLLLDNDGTPTLEIDAFWAELARINAEPNHIFRINMGWFNVPGMTKVYGSEPGSKKIILRKGISNDFVLDVGFHFWDWSRRCDMDGFGGVGKSKLGFLHFHNKPYEKYIASAKEKLKQRVPDFSIETLKNYKGAGVHLVQHLMSTEQGYYTSFKSKAAAGIDVSGIFRRLGVVHPYSEGIETQAPSDLKARPSATLEETTAASTMTTLDVVVVATEKYGLDALGKADPDVFFPVLRSCLESYGARVSIYESSSEFFEDKKMFGHAALLLIYNESCALTANAQAELNQIVSTCKARSLKTVVCNLPESALIIGHKRLANIELTHAGVRMPRLIDEYSGKPIFTNDLIGSGATVALGNAVDPSKYNTEYIDTTHTFEDKAYYVSLRAMCVGPTVYAVIPRARNKAENNASVHTSNTPVDARLLNYLYASVIMPRMENIISLCRSVSTRLGFGFYAYDILPEQSSTQVYLCEAGFKYDEFSARQYWDRIKNELLCADFMFPRVIEMAALLFLQQSKELIAAD